MTSALVLPESRDGRARAGRAGFVCQRGLARVAYRAGVTRVLFFSDTHLGLDWPARPRVDRPRRGDSLYANAERVATRALAGDIDLVIHGGDLFHRPDVPLWVAERGYSLVRRVADRGVPVAVVPGNHERGALPFPLLARHPAIHVFDRPRTALVHARGQRVALGGFPYLRRVRAAFRAQLAATALETAEADLKLLCAHHCFEGARVGTHDWVFRDADDVVRGADVPAVAAVLSGHVHRHQVLTRDLLGAPLAAPVLYAGSVERTSVAERGEAKGYLVLDFDAGKLTRWQFEALPTVYFEWRRRDRDQRCATRSPPSAGARTTSRAPGGFTRCA